MTRIESSNDLLDQYYTKRNVIDSCVSIINKYCDLSGLTLIDTSCGNNYFAFKLNIPHYSYDICLPETVFQSNKTIKITNGNFLGCQLPNGIGNTIMGFNPPYGLRNQMTKQFLTKIFKYKPKYIALILLKPINNNWVIPGYNVLYKQDLPSDSFISDKEIPTEFIIWEYCTNEPISTFLPRAKIQKFKGDLVSISRTTRYNVRHWCSIAVRYCGVNAGYHYYIFHHNNVYFHDYSKGIHKLVDSPIHKLSNVFTIVNFKKNYTLDSLERIVLFCFKESGKYINKKAIRYNFNTGDVVKIFQQLLM
jgi:predicted RNA methylase